MISLSPLKTTLSLAAAIALFASAPALADTIYASPSGTNVGACTQSSNPCPLQTAISQASSGSELVLEPGTYVSHQAPIQVGTQLDIHGEDGQPAPTIVNDHSSCAANDIVCLGQNTITIGATGSLRHLRVIETGGKGSSPFAIQSYAGGETIEDVYAESADGVAINAAASAVIRDTVAWAPSSQWAAIAAWAPAQVRLENVTAVGGPNAYGLWLYEDCLSGCGTGLFVQSQNTILRGGAGDIANPGQFAVAWSVTASYSNYDVPASDNITSSNTDANQSAAPQFVDAANGDFRELESSPTRDAGVASTDLGPVSLGGGARTVGSAPDIGAYEWTPAPAAPLQPQGPRGGNPPTGPSTTSTALVFHGVRLAGGALRARHGKVRVRVSCPAQAAGYCKGVLTLRASHARFTLKPGHSKQVSVSLARKLRKLRRFSATVMATARDAHGQSFSTRAKVRVKRG